MRKNLKFEIIRGAASILLALAVAMIFIFIISKSPFEALYNLIIGPAAGPLPRSGTSGSSWSG